MGGTIKFFLKRLLGHEKFRSMVSWATEYFLKNLQNPPAPFSYILNVRFLTGSDTKSNNRGIQHANYINFDNRKTLKTYKAITSFVSNSVENTAQQKFLQECFQKSSCCGFYVSLLTILFSKRREYLTKIKTHYSDEVKMQPGRKEFRKCFKIFV